MCPYPRPDGIVKAFFAGEVREDLLLPYPILDPAQTAKVDGIVAAFNEMAARLVDPRAIDRDDVIPDSVRQAMAELGLFGLTIPEKYGGLGLGMGAYARVIAAITHVCPALMLLLGAHLSIGLKGLLLYGNDEQKARYLPSLATGKVIAAFALTEPQAGSDAQSIQSVAVRDGSGWKLNGSKIWISNGDIAGMITVFARTPEVDSKDPLTAFLVEPSFAGFSVGPHAQKMGLRGNNASVLRFNDVHIPAENVLGDPGRGFRIAVHILNSGRLGLAASCAGTMKHCLELAVKWAKERKAFGASIAEYELMQRKVAQMAIDILATESMAQVATGLAEKGLDYEVEAAIAKVYSSEAMWKTADELVQMAGGRGYVGPFPYERILRDARVERIFEGTNEILRLFIVEQGVKPIARYMRESSKTPRGMLEWSLSRLARLGPAKLAVFRQDGLANFGQVLANTVGKLHRAAARTLQREGKNLAQHQIQVARLAEMAMDAYGMAAVLSRLQNVSADAEAFEATRAVAEPLFGQALARFESNRRGLERNDDPAWVRVSKMAYERGGDPLEHLGATLPATGFEDRL